MKKLLSVLFIMGSILRAEAGEIVVYYGRAINYDFNAFSKGAFEINKGLGRARISLEFNSADPEDSGETVYVQIPGMKFDKTTKEVIIETNEGRIVCAYEKRGFLGVRSLKETKDCKFKESFSTVVYDDGFNVHKVKMRTITFSY